MFRVSKSQLDALSVGLLAGFEERVVRTIMKCMPLYIASCGESRIRDIVHQGVMRARVYGFDTERQIYVFIALAMKIGWTFDSDPRLTWFSRILVDESIGSPETRLRDLHFASGKYLEQLSDGLCRLENVCARLSILPIEGTTSPCSFLLPADWPSTDMLSIVEGVAPTEAAQRDKQFLRRLIESALQKSTYYGIVDEWGRTAFVGASFLLGSCLDEDPLFPWVYREGNEHWVASGLNLLENIDSYCRRLLSFSRAQDKEFSNG